MGYRLRDNDIDRIGHWHGDGAATDPVRAGAGASLRTSPAAAFRLLLGARAVALEWLPLRLVRRSLGRRRPALWPLDTRALAVERRSLHLDPRPLGLIRSVQFDDHRHVI